MLAKYEFIQRKFLNGKFSDNKLLEIILKRIYLSKINEKHHQCLYPIHQQMICNIYDFVFQCSILEK